MLPFVLKDYWKKDVNMIDPLLYALREFTND